MNVRASAVREQRIGYHAMRLLRFRRALRDFFRRWGLYLLIGFGIFGAGSDAPLTIVAAAASLLLWPMRAAADQGWLLVPATLAYALVGMLPVVLTRPLWWPHRWADAERALPIATEQIHRSDRIFGALVMLPWQALQLAGWMGIAWHGDVTQGDLRRGLAFGGWVVAAAGSLWLSSRWMRLVRRPGRVGVDRGKSRPRARDHRPVVRVLGAAGGIGRAAAIARSRTRQRMAARDGHDRDRFLRFADRVDAPVDRMGPRVERGRRADGDEPAARPDHARAAPLWRDARHLPLGGRDCEWVRRAVTLVPAVLGVLAGVVAAGAAWPVRPTAFALYTFALAVGCGIESGEAETMDPTHHAARWMLLLATTIACGSEVAPS